MKYQRLSAEDEKAFLDGLDIIWDSVAVDCLSGVACERGIKTKRTNYGHLAPYEQVTMPRSTVIDIVTDMFAGRAFNEHMPDEQFKRIRTWILATPGHIVDKVVAKRFHYRRYGA